MTVVERFTLPIYQSCIFLQLTKKRVRTFVKSEPLLTRRGYLSFLKGNRLVLYMYPHGTLNLHHDISQTNVVFFAKRFIRLFRYVTVFFVIDSLRWLLYISTESILFLDRDVYSTQMFKEEKKV